MNTWAPLWSVVVESSLWDEPDYVVKIFLTMMAVKDADHICRFTAYQIARKARKTEQEVLDALKILSSPDKRRVEPQEYGGRRIKAVEEGWLILNGEKYRSMVQEEMRRARNRRAQKAYRERKKAKPNSTAQERHYVKVYEEKGPEEADKLMEENKSEPYHISGEIH